ncbi:putative disease resistance protein [Citrus sinensis]|uniref:Disease resistance protein n=1 Tax=Citrus sinensis TaxID=2711 RepID=A0ACB8KM80_CITSI|nr:putative disease resistance protein [Citrus sinensis]
MAAELGYAVVSGVASKVAEILFDPIRREISYVFKCQSNLQELRSQVAELKNKREREQQRVGYADRQGDVIHKDVEQWLIKVNEFIERVEKAIDEVEEDETNNNYEKRRTFRELCPNNLMARYKLSKVAVKATEEGGILLRKWISSDIVSYRPATESTKLVLNRDYEEFESRMSIFQEIMVALKDGSNNLIGLYGMGGVGKTTLVKEVARRAIVEKLFDTVVVAEVKQNPDLRTIQEEIAYCLDMEFGQHESAFVRAHRLWKILSRDKRILVILDDIWTTPDLHAIGIPFGDDRAKGGVDNQRPLTLLLTSRNQHVLCNHMNTRKIFSIGLLSNEEASHLFEKIVGHSAKKSDFEPIGVEIVAKCGGLPIAIKTIANALKNKSPRIWKDAVNQLSNSNPRKIQGMDADLSSIELSYEFLKCKEVKSLFQLCGLLKDGSRIAVDDLLRYVMGLRLLTNADTLEAARNRVHTLIDNLKSASLLFDGDSEDHVKMHRIIHAIAVSIAAEKLLFNIQNVADLKEELDKIDEAPTAISIPLRSIYELPERLGFLKLKLFLFFTENLSLQIPDPFFEGMTELRVLDLTGFRFPSLPSSLGCLINLRTLSLENCLVGDVAIIGDLKKLEILSLKHSSIEQLPREIGQLTCLKLLDLSNCSKLKEIRPNVISNLTRLEELYMGNSFTQWEVEGQSNASLGELKQLSRLTTLEVHIPDAQVMPQDLVFVELERFRICIGDVWSWSDGYETSKILKLQLNNSTYLGYGMKMLLKRTEDLHLDELAGLKNVVHELDDEEGFARLRHLHIHNGPEILHILNSDGRVGTFPLLESLFLHNLINLEKVCDGKVRLNEDDKSFSNLRIIKVEGCHRVKHLFPFSLVKNLLQLQKVKVTDCTNLKLIVGKESENSAHKNGSISGVYFRKLHFLKLQHLPQLTSSGFDLEAPTNTQGSNPGIIAEGDPKDFTSLFNERVVFPSLKKLKLSSINVEKIWLNSFSAIESWGKNLTKLTVEKCGRLKFLFSSSMVNGLEQLQRLDISHCKSMNEVINTRVGRDDNMIEMVFPKLVSLQLSHLPKLTRFGIGDSVEFPSLCQLQIACCPNLKIFICSCTEEMSSEKNIHTTQTQPLFDEKVGLPKLEVLRIDGMDNLRKIWHHQLALDSFTKLKDLDVEYCDQLLSIFPSNMLRRLERLEHLAVSECGSIEEIVEISSNCTVETAPGVVFRQLTSLKLHWLPRLKSFCPGIHISGWLVLKNLDVFECDKFETFSS